MAREAVARIVFVRGDGYGGPLEVPANEVRPEVYGIVWRPAGEQPPYDKIFPWHRIEEVMIDLPEMEPLVRFE
jgi:hypothetical protein